jgi:hypothetical protein
MFDQLWKHIATKMCIFLFFCIKLGTANTQAKIANHILQSVDDTTRLNQPFECVSRMEASASGVSTEIRGIANISNLNRVHALPCKSLRSSPMQWCPASGIKIKGYIYLDSSLLILR